MAAYINIRMLARASYRVVEGRGVGHDRGACQDAFSESAQNARIYPGRQAEVIRVDDQCFHWGREVAGACKSYHGPLPGREARRQLGKCDLIYTGAAAGLAIRLPNPNTIDEVP